MPFEPFITLYDISSTLTPQAWSPNTLKARSVLNFKCIPYKTVWLSYPDIEPTLKELGASPTSTKPGSPSQPYYTLPAIIDTSSGTPVIVTDSSVIAEYLDAKYPDRPVFPPKGKALHYAFEKCFSSLVGPHFDVMRPYSYAVLDDRGKEYFQQTRELWYGLKIEDFSPESTDGQWEALKKGLDQFAAILDKNGLDVDYVAGGNEPTWADIVLTSWLAWVKIAAPKEWDRRVKNWSGGRWDRILIKSEAWRVVQ